MLFQPFALAAVSRCELIVGAVLSMLMPVTDAFALLPALSEQAPSTCWFAASVDNVESGVLDSTPEVGSLQAKETKTLVLFQPFAFANGARLPLRDGAVPSYLKDN